MNLKKNIKKLLIALFLTIIIIFLNNFTLKSKAATRPKSAMEILDNSYYSREEYFEMDCEALMKSYNKYSIVSIPLGGNVEKYFDIIEYCCGQIMGGNGNDWRIGGIIDVDGEGNVVVYGCTSTGVTTKKEVTNSTDRKYFNTMAAIYHMARNHIGEMDGDYVQYYWHKRIASGPASRYNISSLYFPNAVVAQGDGWGLDKVIDNIEKSYDGKVFSSMKGMKTRLVFWYIKDGQQRISGVAIQDTGKKITLKKKDADTGNPLKGAKFDFYEVGREKPIATGLSTDKNGEITIKNSGANIVISHGGKSKTVKKINLTKGKKYKFVETAPPKGYIMPKKNTVSDKLTGNSLELSMKNPRKYLRLKIIKVDSKTQKRLYGAKFKVLDADGKKVASGKTNTDGEWVSDYVFEIGKEYSIVEITAPSGHIKIEEPINIKISRNISKKEPTFEIVILNEPGGPPSTDIPLGDGLVKVLEIDGEKTDSPVKGMQFGIKNWEPDNKEYKVDGKREPQTSDSKYWGNVYHSSGYWYNYTVTEKDENGEDKQVQKSKWIDTSYYTYEYLYPEQYAVDHAVWEDWKKGNEYYHKSQKDYMATATSIEDGTISLTGFRTDGSYDLYEIGSENPYFVVKGAPKLIMSGYRNTTSDLVGNERTYVDIEGTVSLEGRDGKENTTDNKQDDGEGINGVKVTLKKNGAEVLSIASGKDSKGSVCNTGHYKFWGDKNNLKIEAKDLSQYVVEFEYNGLKYESIPEINLEEGDGSKAIESTEERDKFNTRYSSVTGKDKINGGISTNLSKEKDVIKYKSQNHKSEVIFKSPDTRYDDIYYADNQYHITANTENAGLDLSQTGEIGGYPYDPSKDTIEDINLIIREREYPDVALASDLDTAEVVINGKSEIYKYNKRSWAIDSDDEESNAFTIEIKASDEYKKSIVREVYQSDVAANKSGYSNLGIYLTYKVVLKNQSSSINVKVEDLVDYFSSDFYAEIIDIGNEFDEMDTLSSTNARRYRSKTVDGLTTKDVKSEGEYNNVIINVNKDIEPGSNYEFYIQYKMKYDSINSLLNYKSKKLENVIELNTISAMKDGKNWTAVDLDSAVGNCYPNDEGTMEDDTDYAPAVEIRLSEEEREITGFVFEDKTDDEFKEKEVREGDGIYSNEDKLIGNVKIQIIDVDRGEVATTFPNSNLGGTKDGVESNDTNGYTIRGFIPGNYILRYTYGDEKYPVQKYKSTIISPNYYSDDLNINEAWFMVWFRDLEGQSIATDNYEGEEKTKFNVPVSEHSNSRVDIEKNLGYEDEMQHIKNGVDVDTGLKIDAYTLKMDLGVENDINRSKEAEEGNVEEYSIPSMNFGIVERPRFKVQIDKTINRIQLIRPDGSILRDFTNFDTPPADTKAMETTKVDRVSKKYGFGSIKRGFVQFEIDAELLENTTLLIEYKFTATNRSELDYINVGFYRQGKSYFDINNLNGYASEISDYVVRQAKIDKAKKDSIVRLSVEKVVDYLDDKLNYDSNSHMIAEETEKTIGHKEKTNANNGWGEPVGLEDFKQYISEEIYNNIKENRSNVEILVGNGLDIKEKTKMLAPGESNEITVLLNKTLNVLNNNENMNYDNIAEIVEVKKTWGREIYKEETPNMYGETLGNLDPTQDIKKITNVREPDSHYSERISIITPTGANRNYTIYAILGIVCIAILTTGIILIKKKVL